MFQDLEPWETMGLDDMVCVNENMVSYYGRHSTRQLVIRGKPIRFCDSFKAFASSTGFMYHSEPYYGAATKIRYPEMAMDVML